MPPQASVVPVRKARKGLMIPIFLGATMVLFAVIVAPVWLMMSHKNEGRAPSITSPAPNTSNRYANANSAVPTNGSASPIVPKLVDAPADLIKFAKSDPSFSSPIVVREVDLNSDGTPEFLAEYQGCLAAYCAIRVLRRSGNKFEDIGGDLTQNLFGALDDVSMGSFTAGPAVTNGYLDLKYTFKDGSGQTFKFDGRQYRKEKK